MQVHINPAAFTADTHVRLLHKGEPGEGALAMMLKTARFEGGAGDVAEFFGQDGAERLLVVGLGEADKRDHHAAEKAGGAVAAALASNFDVAAARETLAAARAGVDVARAGLRPTVSLQGELARVKETDVQQPHQRDNVAEATVQLTVPLYQGGLVAAETRQAREMADRTALQRDLAGRQARQLASQFWDGLAAARERVRDAQESVSANQVAARGIARQQSVGARTLIEVLNAQQELFAAEVTLVSARHDALLQALRLLDATGRLSAERLALPAAPYDPLRHYHQVRDRWGGTEIPP